MRASLILLIGLVALTYSCSNPDQDLEGINGDISGMLNLPQEPYNYANPDLPSHFLTNNIEGIDNTPNNNQVTDAGATLGRVLFYDTRLSGNNTVSCASCHDQALGFSDNEVLSLGFEGGETARNSMGLANSRYYNNGRFFWDERANTLEIQTLLPIQDEVEMGLTLDELVSKIQAEDFYQPLFTEAFGDASVSNSRISLALSQFVRSMVSFESRYDEGLASVNGNNNADFLNFSELENLGKDLFFSGRTQCSNCHETATFSGDQARNNGLDLISIDLGLGGVTGNPRDNGKFKVNSLRNILLTAPYMHDGRFETLEQVVEFYDRGIQNNQNLDNRLRTNNGNVRRMNLNPQERQALVAFLRTLTDENFINDVKFSNPFINN